MSYSSGRRNERGKYGKIEQIHCRRTIKIDRWRIWPPATCLISTKSPVDNANEPRVGKIGERKIKDKGNSKKKKK
jgi:hypothetical protein